MPPLGATRTLELSISLNGRFDSRQPVANITFYDNFLVKISSMTPGAGPILGGTIITVRGGGFADYGGANCVLTRGGILPLFAPATVQNESIITCEPTAAMATTAGSQRMTLGIVLNGQFTTQVGVRGFGHARARPWEGGCGSLLGMSISNQLCGSGHAY